MSKKNLTKVLHRGLVSERIFRRLLDGTYKFLEHVHHELLWDFFSQLNHRVFECALQIHPLIDWYSQAVFGEGAFFTWVDVTFVKLEIA